MVKITIDTDSYYAPCSYLICKVDSDGYWDTRDEENTILVQCDYEFVALANLYGYTGDSIPEAEEYLDEYLGEVIDDPGYFDTDA